MIRTIFKDKKRTKHGGVESKDCEKINDRMLFDFRKI